MNSPFANIFLALQQRIQTAVLNTDGTPMITYINQDLGQLDHYKIRPAVSFPAVLIDFDEWRFSQLATNIQVAEGTIVLRLAFPSYSPSSSDTPDTYKAKAISYYDIEWALQLALQGWSPGDDYGVLVRTHATTEERKDHIRIRQIKYSLKFEDYSTQTSMQQVHAAFVLTE